MWHDQRWATSVVPAVSASRRRPRDARARLMSPRSRASKRDSAGAVLAASASAADGEAGIASQGALSAAERRKAWRSRAGRKVDIWDFPVAGQDKRGSPASFESDASQGRALPVKAHPRVHADG